MAQLSQLPLFANMEESDCLRMLDCFHTSPRTFHGGDTAYTYSAGTSPTLGILQEGQAALVKIDAGGGRTVLERLSRGGVFGELVAFSSLPCDSVSLVCETDCVVVFLPQGKLTSPCGKACSCHKQLLENLLGLMSQKAFDLSERVEVLSCRTIREKLLCYFRICAGQNQSLSFTLPFSLSDLADYICSDRSAMMRELKRLREEGFLEISGRNVRFKSSLCAASFPKE
ncbi:cyclic nucleotide-binding domain protein [Clostridium sp. CAG:1013]|nr:cyclic nucleotide-binding domain protein [Clostridium sp. CAG:1013]